MNDKVLQTVEYDKIVEMLKGKAISTMGKEACGELKPVCDLSTIRLWQKETTEAVSYVLKKGSLPLGGLKDIRGSLKRVMVGGILSIEELLHVGDFLYVCKKAVNYSKNENKRDFFELLDEKFSLIILEPELEREISRCIIGQQEIADDASTTLLETRRSIKNSNDKVKESLNSIIHSQTYKTMLQDTVITIRNERFCVPVKQEYRNSFPGMVHDQSSSGATLFIEPMSVVQLNNKLKELHAKEKTEIEKILKNLSELVNEKNEHLQDNTEILAGLDFVFAKAELSLAMNGTEPEFNTKGFIYIKKGRHPLLNKETVVPTDIYLGDKFSTLLITGPNTGGKTVSLKTTGLFTLMGQAGLHIAANDHSELSVFDDVYADIGDEQSIEQSLSTFSSHMSNIVRILKVVTNNSLVLLDELGAGTDPTEGAALAIAILQYLYRRNIRTLVTTHYSELKVYALTTEGVENASCEFNVETLKPTYKLLIGIPGKSNAFAISSKLGLGEDIISEAKQILNSEDVRFEDIITDLEISRKTVILEEEKAARYRLEAEKLKSEFEKQKQKLNDQRDKILLQAREEARKVMQDTKDEADRLIKEVLKKTRESMAQKDIDETRQKIKTSLSSLEDEVAKMSAPKKTLRPLPKNLKKGDRVFIHSMNQTGIVVNPPDTNGEAMIQAGIMKIKINISNLSLDETEEKAKTKVIGQLRTTKQAKTRNISSEIDLRGMMVDEGVERADKYLDDAYLSGINQVTIIHGKGTGALRSAIQSHLKNHPHVKSYRLGVFGEGETGVTIVELK